MRRAQKKRFHDNLAKQLRTWTEQGDHLVVCLDANNHIYRKGIERALTDADGLDMKEVNGAFTGKRLGVTHFRGKRPIDGIGLPGT